MVKYKPGTLLCISKVMEGGIAKQKKNAKYGVSKLFLKQSEP